jgi:methionyl-tRNA synthetase
MAEDGRKMSKSFGNVIDPNYLIDNYGSDITRYYFIKEFLIDSDNNFSMKKFIELYNSDLANIYGNIVSRTIGMINLYNAGVVAKINDVITEQMKQLLSAKTKLLDKVDELVNQFKIRDLLIQINEFGKEINKYIENTKP